MLARLKTYYADQMMRPGFGGLFINPFYFARKELLAAVKELAPAACSTSAAALARTRA